MKNNSHIILLGFLGLTIISCSPKVKFYTKNVIIAGTNPIEKTDIQVPVRCDRFESGVEVTIDAAVKYAGQEASLNGSFEKINIISQFSDRIKTITTAQCKITQTAIVIDPKNSDYMIYTNMIKGYVEYQKIADLANSELGADDKSKVIDAFLEVYKNLYNEKKEEVVTQVKDLTIKFRTSTSIGNVVDIFRNDVLLEKKDLNNSLKYTLGKTYLIPAPSESVKFKFVLYTNGQKASEKEYALSGLMLASESNEVTIEL